MVTNTHIIVFFLIGDTIHEDNIMAHHAENNSANQTIHLASNYIHTEDNEYTENELLK